ncbi:DUF1127 domain-containing protein [Paracoccus aestuariivivens]|uniref:DUF1127 domain-containing protein n=1 Tax=Paracoccus aestuariivivens TaxID=1820333 RepID=A0A6L6J8E9_9RHOB|nr:DUF1127 domain-containing protein [Paracoccus aestuariivivens]MTH78423.1 DUF1127 domain-containing protein [Paracoccus aestuariivivens]
MAKPTFRPFTTLFYRRPIRRGIGNLSDHLLRDIGFGPGSIRQR